VPDSDTVLEPDSDIHALVREQLVHDLLYESPVALLVVDDDMRVLVANAAATKLSGYTIDELTQLEAGAISADPERSAHKAGLVHLGGRLASTSRVRHKDGHDVRCSYFAWEVVVSGMPFIAILLWPDA
jgi:PAS domain S-box-containing protein